LLNHGDYLMPFGFRRQCLFSAFRLKVKGSFLQPVIRRLRLQVMFLYGYMIPGAEVIGRFGHPDVIFLDERRHLYVEGLSRLKPGRWPPVSRCEIKGQWKTGWADANYSSNSLPGGSGLYLIGT